jgi:rhodanese-related sulfurtransferase
VVLVCDGLVRSVMTAGWLARLGLPDVSVLAGGFPGWAAEGRPVERGRPAAAPFGYEAARARAGAVAPGELDPGATVLDVDQSDAYARGHVPGAGWVCRSRLELRMGQIAPDRGRPLVVTCTDGHASALAAATLVGLGYKDVRALAGGTRAWAEAGRPLERGETRMLDEPDDVVLKPYERGRAAMEAYLRWEEHLDEEGRSPNPLRPAN